MLQVFSRVNHSHPLVLSLHFESYAVANVSTHTVKCRRSRVCNMAVAGGVPDLRVAVLAMTAELQSLMPQKVVDRSQDGAEPGEHVD